MSYLFRGQKSSHFLSFSPHLPFSPLGVGLLVGWLVDWSQIYGSAAELCSASGEDTVCQWNQTNQGNGILFQATFYGRVEVCSKGTIEEKHKT